MFRRLTLSLMLIVAGFVAGLVVTGRTRTTAESEAHLVPLTPHLAPSASADPQPRPAAAPAPVNQTGGFAGSGLDFTRVAGQAVKGVANISSLQVVRTRNSPLNDPLFNYLFGGDDSFVRDRRSMSLGSGVIISADGYVITN